MEDPDLSGEPPTGETAPTGELAPGGAVVTVRLEQRLAGSPRDRYVELRPAVEYRRVPPRLVNPELPRPVATVRYADGSVGRSAPQGMATFRDVTLSWGTTIELDDGRVLEEALQSDQYPPIRGEQPRRSYDEAVIGCRRGHRNYGHFLIEVLPSLLLSEEVLTDEPPIILHVGSKAFARPLLQAAGIRPDRIRWIGQGPFHLGEAHWLTAPVVSLNVISPHAVAAVHRLTEMVGDGRRRFRRRKRRRLYVGRRDATTRHLLNEDDLLARLERRGFEPVYPGVLSFEEQVRTFSQAEVVVGVAGAALTNIAFMPPGGAVMLLAPESMAGYYFWDLATHAGLDFTIQWGPVGPPEHYAGGVRVVDDPRAQTIHADFRIDVDLAERTLKDAGLW